MSYILDALKKSEQERGQDHSPGIQTIHSAGINYYAERKIPWFIIVFTAVIINAAVLTYFFVSNENKDVETDDLVSSLNTNAIQTPVITTKNTGNPVISSSKITQSSDQIIISEALYDQHELPANIKQQIPEMEFSAHIFSSNPLQRSVVINGKFLEESEQLIDGLILKEITQKGAIFNFRGYQFRTGVISSWDIN